MVLTEDNEKYVVEGFVKKLFHNPRKTPTKDGMDYWQAIILDDDTRIHYYGHVIVQEGLYIHAEMSKPKTGEYPRCNSLEILPSPVEPGADQQEEPSSTTPPSTQSYPSHYHAFEKAKMRMNAGSLAKSLHETAVQSAKRNEDGSLNADSYKEYLSLFSTEARRVWKQMAAFNYGEYDE